MLLGAYMLIGLLVGLRCAHVHKPKNDNWSWYLIALNPVLLLLWPLSLGDMRRDREEEEIQAERDRVERERRIAALEEEAFESFEDFMARLDRELETPEERAEREREMLRGHPIEEVYSHGGVIPIRRAPRPDWWGTYQENGGRA